MKPSCTKTIRVSAPCSQCRQWAAVVHIQSSSLDLRCESCCAACSAARAVAKAETVEAIPEVSHQ
jgi:hypothetical protein